MTTPKDHYKIVKSSICKGELYDYIDYLEQFEIKDSLDFLEYALVYGRVDILTHMISKNFYSYALLDPNYNPFDLSNNISIDLVRDVHDGSYWGNDERDRMIVNRIGINHELCFQLMEKFGKKLNLSNIEKWFVIEGKYFTNTYFASPSLLIKYLFINDGTELTIKNVIQLIESFSMKFDILKILISVFKSQELIEQLKK